jgi:hypothetical protein
MSFMFGNRDKEGTIIKTVANKQGQNDYDEVKKIIVLGHDSVVPGNPNIRHPKTKNEDDNEGGGIIDLS